LDGIQSLRLAGRDVESVGNVAMHVLMTCSLRASRQD
jgi:hypothetical protein